MTNPFTRLFRARDKPGRRVLLKNAVSAAPTFYFGSSVSGKSVTARSAIQVSTVYACVRVIAETVASLPLNVFETTDKGGVKALEHPLQHLLHDEPNPEMTSFIWRETMLSHLLLWGNAYCQIIRTGRNGIAGLYPLLPDHMEVEPRQQGQADLHLHHQRRPHGAPRSHGRPAHPRLGFDASWATAPSRWRKALSA